MREIKFRVWFGDGLYFVKRIDWTNGGRTVVVVPDVPPPTRSLAVRDPLHLMQYTGRKDKDGVEIYEEDLVKDSDDSVFMVNWRDDRYVINDLGRTPDDVFEGIDFEWDELEIIGNIYVNPELIGDSNGNND